MTGAIMKIRRPVNKEFCSQKNSRNKIRWIYKNITNCNEMHSVIRNLEWCRHYEQRSSCFLVLNEDGAPEIFIFNLVLLIKRKKKWLRRRRDDEKARAKS